MKSEHSGHVQPNDIAEPQPLAPQFDAWQELEEVHRRMETLLQRTFGFDPKGFHRSGLREAPEPGPVRGMEPDVDIFENDREFLLYVALPGTHPHDIDLLASETTLTLTADIQSPFAGSGDEESYHTHHRRSRRSRHSRFHFSYRLPADIRPDEVQANYRHAILELHLPKRSVTAGKARSIPIHLDGGANQPASAVGDLAVSYSMQPAPRIHEGAPGNKLGPAYVPSASEDHTATAQSIGARTEDASAGHGKQAYLHVPSATHMGVGEDPDSAGQNDSERERPHGKH